MRGTGKFDVGIARRRVIHTIWLICGMAVAGCGNETPTYSAPSVDAVANPLSNESESDAVACRKEDYADEGYDFNAQFLAQHDLAAKTNTPFRCLRLVESMESSRSERDHLFVNIGDNSSEAGDAKGELRIRLHEIKTKAFLHDRRIAILSNGKQFAALEKECGDIKASGVADIVAILPTHSVPAGDRNVTISDLPRISPREFITERSFGVWRVVNLTGGDLESPLFLGMASTLPGEAVDYGQRRAGASLVRTLIVAEGNNPAAAVASLKLQANGGLTFVLDGGLSSLHRFQVEATAMARARAGPRINERGCAG